MATKYISVINLNNEDLTIKDTEARKQISDLNIGTISSDVSALKTDVSSLKSDNTSNKAEISSLKSDNTSNKAEISSLKSDNTSNKANIEKLQSEVVKITCASSTEKITITVGE